MKLQGTACVEFDGSIEREISQLLSHPSELKKENLKT
jgi:hypothetical protein